MRTLVAGFGNVLRGDDGFGVEVIRRLAEMGQANGDVELMDVGTGGLRLAQELLTVYDRLIIVDAMTRGGAPGSLYVLEVESVAAASQIDMHLAVPARALSVAQALGALPRQVLMVGCEPAEVDELITDLSPCVSDAVERAVRTIATMLSSEWMAGAGVSGMSKMQPEEDR